MRLLLFLLSSFWLQEQPTFTWSLPEGTRQFSSLRKFCFLNMSCVIKFAKCCRSNFFVSDNFCCAYHISTGNRVGRRQPRVPVMEKSPPSRLHGVLLFQRDQRGHDPWGDQAGAHSGRTVYIQVRGRSVSINMNAAEERGA